MTTCWKEQLQERCKKNNDDYEKLICTLSEKELEEEFDDICASTEGQSFTAWSDNYVYFPVSCEGMEWASSAPRNPCDIKTNPIGEYNYT